MAQHEQARRNKTGEAEAEGNRHRHNGSQPVYDNLMSQVEEVLPLLRDTHPENHAALLADVPSAAQRARITTHLQRSLGNSYVQRVVENTQRRMISKLAAPAATSVAAPEEEAQAPTAEAPTETTTGAAPERGSPAPRAEAPTETTTGSAAEERAETPAAESPTRSTVEEQAPAPAAEGTAEAPTSATTEGGETESETETGELEPAIEIQRREELARLRVRWERWAVSPARQAQAAIGRTPPDYHTAGNHIYNVRAEVRSMLENRSVPDEVKERIRLLGDSADLAEQTLNTLQRPDEEVTHRIEALMGLADPGHIFGE